MHNEPGLPVGEFATRGGAFYANVDRFVFKVTGKGAHAARPHEGRDAILLASQRREQKKRHDKEQRTEVDPNSPITLDGLVLLH